MLTIGVPGANESVPALETSGDSRAEIRVAVEVSFDTRCPGFEYRRLQDCAKINRATACHGAAEPAKLCACGRVDPKQLGDALMLLLTEQELDELTGRRRVDARKRALDAMKIPYRQRHDGSIVVLRCHVIGEAPSAEGSFVEIEPQLQP